MGRMLGGGGGDGAPSPTHSLPGPHTAALTRPPGTHPPAPQMGHYPEPPNGRLSPGPAWLLLPLPARPAAPQPQARCRAIHRPRTKPGAGWLRRTGAALARTHRGGSDGSRERPRGCCRCRCRVLELSARRPQPTAALNRLRAGRGATGRRGAAAAAEEEQQPQETGRPPRRAHGVHLTEELPRPGACPPPAEG